MLQQFNIRLSCYGIRSNVPRLIHAQRAVRTPSSSKPQTCHSRHQDPAAAYIHLPFCKRKCFYCDFPVTAVGRNASAPHVQQSMQQYVDMLCMEIEATRQLGEQPLQTIYFGGGTPSLVPPQLIQRILHTVQSRFGIHPNAEISMEADPGTFDADRLAQYIGTGVTRISMGVQSFQQELLEACGRSHSLEEVHEAIQAVRGSGIGSWSLDLISGLPNLNMSSWRHSLQEAIRAGPDHISVYDLQVEEGTPFARWYDQGKLSFPKDDDAAEMYEEAVALLTAAGYEHYEVSNYAKPGHRSRHNQTYWRGVPYYAFGVGAASYLEGRRFSRPSKMQAYFSWVQGGMAAPGAESEEAGVGSQEDAMLDDIMLQLRTADGLDLHLFAATYGDEAAAVVHAAVQGHLKTGLVLQLPRLHPKPEIGKEKQKQQSSRGDTILSVSGVDKGHSNGQHGGSSHEGSMDTSAAAIEPCQTSECQWDFRLRLSDPGGFLVSNSIISDVFAAFSFQPAAAK